MWDDRFLEVCRRHPDVIAVYESAHGRLGLLLRQTLVPLGVERVPWLADTRTTAPFGASRPKLLASSGVNGWMATPSQPRTT